MISETFRQLLESIYVWTRDSDSPEERDINTVIRAIERAIYNSTTDDLEAICSGFLDAEDEMDRLKEMEEMEEDVDKWIASQEWQISPYDPLIIECRNKKYGDTWFGYRYCKSREDAEKELERIIRISKTV